MEKGKSKWDIFVTRCPKCDSSDLTKLNEYQYTFSKVKREVQKCKCNLCGYIFYDDEYR